MKSTRTANVAMILKEEYREAVKDAIFFEKLTRNYAKWEWCAENVWRDECYIERDK